MNRQIKYIVHTSSRYNDYFGNSYHFTRITRTSTGKSVVIDDCVEGNAVALIRDADSSLNRHSSQPIHRINEWEKATEWKRRRKFARGCDGANSTTPLNPYRSEAVAKAIRALSSKAAPEYTGADVDLNV